MSKDLETHVSHSNTKDLFIERFQELGGESPRRSTNTLGIYDLGPKYARQNNQPYVVDSAEDSVRVSDFSFNGSDYVFVVRAAPIVDADLKTRYYFPSTYEELIEDVLRHLTTTNKQNVFWEDNYGCQFSLTFIYNELSRFKKARSKREIRRSLNILQGSMLYIYHKHKYDFGRGDPLFSGSFFSESNVINLQDYYRRSDIDENNKLFGRAKFHNMVTESIKNVDYRLNRYDVCMKYRNDMARWLHKRISHLHTQADIDIPFVIRLTTVFNDGNWIWQDRKDRNKAKFMGALKEMNSLGMINLDRSFIDKIISDGLVCDYAATIFLTKEFVDHIIFSNLIQKENRKAIQDGVQGHDRSIDAQTGPALLKRNASFLQLVSLGVSEEAITNWIEKHGIEETLRAAEYTLNQRSKKLSKKKDQHFDVKAYCQASLDSGWHASVKTLYTDALLEKTATEKDNSGGESVVEINPGDYSGLLREFVIEEVLSKPDSVKRGFLKNSVNQGDLYPLWIRFEEKRESIEGDFDSATDSKEVE